MVTGNRRRSDRRGGQRGKEDSEDAGYVEHVVKIRRVSKVTKGGRNLTFNAMVVVGDGNGKVGAALGKAGAVPDAVRKGSASAKREMRKIRLKDTTIPHEVTTRFSGAIVMLKPASPGTGLIAGGGVRAVLEAAGVKDVLTKTFGSSNSINVVKATMKALQTLRDPGEELKKRRAH